MAIIVPFLQGRSAQPSLVINGQDVLLGLDTKSLISFCYTDSTSDKADDLSVDIGDPNRTWMLRYLPADAKKGVECEASIKITNWLFPGDTRIFQCGKFWITDVGFKGPPNAVSVKCSSIPPNGAKNEKKHKSWEATTLKDTAGQIASQNELTLFYDTEQNPSVKRTDQVDKSDLEYLRERAKEAGLSMKIHNKQLVIYSEEEYEQREAAFILIYGQKQVLDYDFNSKLDDTYASSKNSYVNPETGKLTDYEFEPEEKPHGTKAKLKHHEEPEIDPDDPEMWDLVPPTVLHVARAGEVTPYLTDYNFTDDDASHNRGKGKGIQAASERKCKKKLREKNKKEQQCSFTVFGNIEYLSGLCCQTQGFGIFDTKWFIDNSTHDLTASGYTTKLSLRKALKGY
jgi:uncharacterized protein